MKIRSFSRIKSRPALYFVWAVAVVFLAASVKTAVGAPLITAALDGHHVPVISLEHGDVHVSLSHGGGHHHHDHGPNSFFPVHSTVGHGHDGDHESHLHEYIEEVAPTKRLKPSLKVSLASEGAFSRASASPLAEASVRYRPPARDPSLLKLSTVVLLN